MVSFHADFVDLVGHVLLLRCFQRFGQSIIEHDPLFRVRLQLVDQHHLRRRLVLQGIDPGFALFDIALQRLRFRQLDLFLLHQFVIARVRSGQLSFQRRALRRVLFYGNFIFQRNNSGVHAGNFRLHTLKVGHGHFAFLQGARQVGFHFGFLFVQHCQLAFKQLGNDIRFADQVLQLVIHRRGTHPFLTQGFRFALGEDPDKSFPSGFRPHFIEIFGESSSYVIQTHDQFGDIGVHRLGVHMHVLKRGVLDIHGDIGATGHLLARGFDPAGQFGNLALCLGNLFLRFTDLRVEIGHAWSLIDNRLCSIWGNL